MAEVSLFRDFLASAGTVFERSHAPGHFTASCWLVSGDGQRLLMTHHRKLERWLQLGGHCDGDRHAQRAALREAEEESGLSDLRVEPALFDIDRHRIPAHGSEAAHWHYDLRFVIRATGSEAFVVSDESHDLAWRDIAGLLEAQETESGIRRMASKWLARQPPSG
ncbi:MAG: NUDIX hydrolase [Xanthomonadales bacterium]|nr:NUDIX hydrolase [Xanthomonadales bacterium]